MVEFAAVARIGDLEALALELRDGERGRRPVRFGENDVEADRGGTMLGQPVDHSGEHGARPRPLPELADALVVDIDDSDRALGGRAGTQRLVAVEDQEIQLFQRAWARHGGNDHDQRGKHAG